MKYDSSVVLRALDYFRQNRGLIFLLLFLIGASTILGLLQAWPFALLIDSAIAPAAPHHNWLQDRFIAAMPREGVWQIVGLALAALLLRLVQELLSTARRLVASRIQYNGLLRVRCDLYRKLQALHLDYHRKTPMGDSLFRLVTDTHGCHTILSVVINLLFAVISLCVMIGVLATIHFALTLIALVVAPALVGTNIFFGRRLTEKTRKAKVSDSDFTTAVHRSMSTMVLTQAYGREDDEFHRFGASARRCVRNWFAIHRQEVGYSLTIGAILALGGSAILVYGGLLLQQKAVTPGELMIFMTYLGMMYEPLCQITGVTFNLQNGLAGARRVFEILDFNAQVTNAPNAVSLPVQPRRLTLEHVSFEYSPGQTVLSDINVVIESGKTIAFVGSSGVGKSTLLNLLPRFYDVTVGAIKLDEWDLRRIKIKDARRHIALALQESVLLPTTIAENIAYARPGAAPHEIRAAAELAGAAAFIEALPESYETQVSEFGANLSGGQRQRIALARALLARAPILVLDEPTSALDAHHEEIVRDTLRSLGGICTVILVSHRISTVSHCERIFVLDYGKIVEQGNHRELLALGGIYAAMARQQQSTEGPVSPEDAEAV